MNTFERSILYTLVGATLATAIIMIFWLKALTYPQIEYLFHQKWDSEEFQKELNTNIEEAIYRIKEIEKQSPKIREEIK